MHRSLEEVFYLAAADVSLIHGGPEDEPGYAGGGDVDCIVDGLDTLWPLRLGPTHRLVNRLRYDVTGTSWFVAGPDAEGILDTLEDPSGIGKYGFRTEGVAGPRRVEPGPAAAYLALKRLRKADIRASAWAQVAALAAADPGVFRAKLVESLPRTGTRLADVALEGQPPDPTLATKATRELRVGRLLSLSRSSRFLTLQAARMKDRLLKPTGLFVLIVGPDGSGKSTIAAALEDEHFGFRRSERAHWRPGLLPGRGSGSPDGHTRPHDVVARGKVASTAMLFYHWADFALGSLVRVFPAKRRSTLIVAERGWWDLAVDPRRYRLDVPPGLVRFMGRLSAKPDVILVLSGAPDAIAERKGELDREEVERQLDAWTGAIDGVAPTVTIETDGGLDGSLADARATVRRAASDRAIGSLGHGWFAVPPKGDVRWWLPRGPRRVAQAAFKMWSPMTSSGSSQWRLGGMAVGVGVGRVMGRVTPPVEVVDLMGPHLGPGETVAIGRANHPHRYVVLIVSPDGGVRRIAKVVTEGDIAPLETEAQALATFAGLLPSPLRAPALLDRSPHVLVLEAVSSLRRKQPWRLPPSVAESLGAFRRESGVSHGDFAPWNLLRSQDGWTLIDWEEAGLGAEPFEDVLHYLFQGHALLGSPSATELIAGVVTGRGWVGESVTAFARGAELSMEDAPDALRRYLIARVDKLTGAGPDVVKALEARSRLTELLRSA